MKINLSDKIIAWLALLSGLTISTVAIWYSVAGLVSIFAAAAIPIIVMGVALEVSKLIATVWLKLNWNRAPVFIRGYLLAAIAVLMLITSMGIFGFLSKAHSDQSLVSGDVQSKIAVYDEKIKTSQDNIDVNRKALKQLDEAVDQVMGRSTSETGADKAVAIRKSQAKERTRLLAEITAEQKTITGLREERAPIAAEVRKVEAEVGPIKYIAAFVYGDNPDANVLEKAVTWVIIIIVSVFDPLAVILLLASQYSFQWFRRAREEQAEGDSPVRIQETEQPTVTELPTEEVKEEAVLEKHPYLNTGKSFWAKPEGWESVPPQVYVPEKVLDAVPEPIPCVKCGTPLTEVPSIGFVCANPECDPLLEELEEQEDSIDGLEESEKAAIKAWKQDNPNTSLKLQRKMLEKGTIKELPWMRYLRPTSDFIDEAAEEAAKWAEEQRILSEEESKKKDNNLDRERGIESDQEIQRDLGYVQNAEQNKSTLWQRVKAKKDDK
jgi:hypothetical protein